jgi:hypothetical protein
VLATSIIRKMRALMMEAESTSETSVNFYQSTQRSTPEDSHLQKGENLKKLQGCVETRRNWMVEKAGIESHRGLVWWSDEWERMWKERSCLFQAAVPEFA